MNARSMVDNGVGLCVLLVVAGAIAWGVRQQHEVDRLRREARAVALVRDSTEAARDTTRAEVLVAAGDSLRVYRRRIVQARQRGDSLDRALGLERAARYEVEAAVAQLDAEVRSRSEVVAAASGDSVRTGEFSVRQAPYSIEAHVALPPAPAEGVMQIRVALDTAVFDARVSCGAAGAGGVQPAELALVGPRWVSVRLRSLEQAPRVCSLEVGSGEGRGRSWFGRLTGLVRVGFGVAAVVGPGGRITTGVGIAAVRGGGS